MNNENEIKKYPLRIHQSLLPKKKICDTDVDGFGFIHGYFFYTEKDWKAIFINKKKVFECTIPIITAQTHLLIRFHAVIFTGYNKSGKQIGELCELVAFFN